jgi:hypothetical protein
MILIINNPFFQIGNKQLKDNFGTVDDIFKFK